MTKQLLLQILRSYSRNKTPFLINVLGMVIGLTAVVLATVIIVDEYQFDQFHTQGDQIFRINKRFTEPGGAISLNAETPGLMAPTLLADFPNIENTTRIAPWFDEVLLTVEDQNIQTDQWIFADPSFFEMFDFKLSSAGTSKELLSSPGQILITVSLAKKLFGTAYPIGQFVKGVGDKLYQVMGLLESAPRRSHIQYEVVASWASTEPQSGFLDFDFMNNWLGQTVNTYIQTNQSTQKETIEQALPAFTAKYMPDRTEMYDFYLQPLSDIYLKSRDLRYLRGGVYGSITFLKSFAWIALLILIIACFNYINLTTARSFKRSKEVGLKKVLGSSKIQLIRQFTLETFLLICIAGCISLVLAGWLLPTINGWFEKSVPTSLLWDPLVLILVLAIITITSLLSGSFPGIVLSQFRPIQVLSSSGKLSPGGKLPREILTILQLSAGIGLIAATIVFQKQFNYLLNKDLGFNKEQIITMKTPPGIDSSYQAFLNEVDQIAGIQSISMCQAVIDEGIFGTTVIPEGNNNQEVPVIAFRVDTNYLTTFGMQMTSGRFFSRTSDFTEPGLIVNESMVNQMGWSQPLSRKIRFPGSEILYPIIGVIQDFHFNSLHETISPLIMYLDSRRANISIQFDPDQIKTILGQLETVWSQFENRYPFEYTFLDEHFAKAYVDEYRMSKIISIYAFIAILIGCIGIYGVVSFSLARRRKEIGIRKVLGSSNVQILQLILQKFLVAIGIACLISIPIVRTILQNWLQNYAYHRPLHIVYFIIAGAIMGSIVLLTVVTKGIQATKINPVQSIRNE